MSSTRGTRPHLLIFGAPPKPWFDAAADLHELADVQLAEESDNDAERVRNAEILFFWEQSQRRLRDLWPHARSLQWVHSSSSGIEKLVFPALAERPVVVTNGRGLYADPLAEFVLFCALYFAKNFPVMAQNRRERRWQRYHPRELLGATMGIVGFGGTGRATARLAKAFGMQVLALKRRPATAEDQQLADRFVPPEARNELLAESDYVVNALPLTPETTAYFDEAAFGAMKASACFMNVGRGGTVDEEALIRALQEGRIAAAGLDVFQREPLPAESGLYSLPNVIVSPHSADLTERYPARSAEFFLQNVKRYVNGELLLNIVDKHLGY